MKSAPIMLLACALIVVCSMAPGCIQSLPAGNGPSGTGSGPGNGSITFADGNSNVITIPKTAERIIASNSDCAEMLIAIGAADRIVGVSDTVMNSPTLMAQLPAGVKSIGSWSTPDIETILELKPDVVVCYTYSTQPTNLDQLVALNITIVALDCYKMGSLSADARTLGMITGNKQQAETYADFFDHYIGLVRSRTSNLTADTEPAVYWESYSDYATVGHGSGGDGMITLAGGNNIAGGLNTTYPTVGAEWVVAQDPAYIFKSIAAANATSADSFTQAQSEVDDRPGFSAVDAVKTNHVYVMSGTFASGARSVIGLLYVSKILHPDLFGDVDPAQVLTEYAEKFLPGADYGTYIYPGQG